MILLLHLLVFLTNAVQRVRPRRFCLRKVCVFFSHRRSSLLNQASTASSSSDRYVPGGAGERIEAMAEVYCKPEDMDEFREYCRQVLPSYQEYTFVWEEEIDIRVQQLEMFGCAHPERLHDFTKLAFSNHQQMRISRGMIQKVANQLALEENLQNKNPFQSHDYAVRAFDRAHDSMNQFRKHVKENFDIDENDPLPEFSDMGVRPFQGLAEIWFDLKSGFFAFIVYLGNSPINQHATWRQCAPTFSSWILRI